LKPGDRVRVERGPLRGVEGTLLREAGDRLRLVIGIEMLQRSLAVEMETDMVTPVRARRAVA
jgi:transcription antitermination factor NusG